MAAEAASSSGVIPSDALLAHWQGHRRLTRRVIEAFPEDRLHIQHRGTRPFGALAMELLSMAAPKARGSATGEWSTTWDRAVPRVEIDQLWARIPPGRLDETLNAFGQYDGVGYDLLLYVIDNEIHHRGQGYVYLRALGIEPPHFWER